MKYIINCILNQSSNEAEVLCSDANDNGVGVHPKGWKFLDRENTKTKEGAMEEREREKNTEEKADEKAVESRKKKAGGILHFLIPTFLFISMLVFGGLFLRDFLEYKAADDEYAQLDKHIVVVQETKKETEEKKEESVAESGSAEETEAPEPVDIAHPTFHIDYDALKKINGDFTAVIYVPAIHISYPVVNSKDNDDYLHKTFEGKANFAGSIFLDANAKGSYDHKNTFIFGHNMKNGSMFGKLKNFLRDDSLANTNPYIFLCKSDGIYRYRIFSYYLTDTSSPIYNDFEGDAGYDSYVKLITRMSSYRNYPKDAVNFANRPNLLTLSTCSGPAGGQQRFIVQGALEEVYAS